MGKFFYKTLHKRFFALWLASVLMAGMAAPAAGFAEKPDGSSSVLLKNAQALGIKGQDSVRVIAELRQEAVADYANRMGLRTMNGFSVTTTLEEALEIETLPDVKKVMIVPDYTLPEPDPEVREAGRETVLAPQVNGKQVSAPQPDEQGIFTIETEGSEDAFTAGIPAEVWSQWLSARPNAKLHFKTPLGTLTLPLREISLAYFAGELGVDEKELSVNVTVRKVSKELTDVIRRTLSGEGALLYGDPIDFAVEVAAMGKPSVEVKQYSRFVRRSINIPQHLPDKATALRYDETAGAVSPVPSWVERQDGETAVHFLRKGGGIYVIAARNKSFDDLIRHRFREDVETLAFKWIVRGMTETEFAPDIKMTRAQFATLLIRALGLESGETAEAALQFRDVAADSWYRNAVTAAVQEGLIQGYDDRTFRPDRVITREEMAVMLQRARQIADPAPLSAPVTEDEALSGFADSDTISSWARSAMAEMVHTGIMQGQEAVRLAPKSYATRAEAAVMLLRLQRTIFMDVEPF